MRIITSKERAAQSKPKTSTVRLSARRIAVKAAVMERKESQYIHLICGDYTTYETQMGYSVWRPKGKLRYFCEHGHGWVLPMPKPKPEPLPDEPMF